MDETKRGPKPVPPAAVKAWKKVRHSFTHGNIKALADHLGISPPAVSKWEHVPENRLDKTAEFLGLRPIDLRPDIYAPARMPWNNLLERN